MSHAAPAQDETEDRYYTQVDDGDVRLFTLDQLDAAFNAGLIHENTYVCLEGSSEWLTLAIVAGLGDSEEEEAPVPQSVAPSPVYVAPAPAPASVAPIASPFAPSISVAPVAARPAVAAYSSVPAPYSVAPMVNDLSFDDDMLTMRPKRHLGKVVAGIAVLGLAAAGIAVAQSGGITLPKLKLDDNAARASAASLTLSSLKEQSQPAKAPEAAAPAPVKEEAKAAETTTASDKTDADSGAKKSDDRFTEDMKAALLAKDKTQTVDQKHKKAARVAVATSRKASSKGSGGGFKSGGSAYDPLNGKL